MNKQKIIALLVVLILSYVFKINEVFEGSVDTSVSTETVSINTDTESIDHLKRLIDNKQSGEMVIIEAQILNILSDDVKGSKHQRLILNVLNTDITLLLAHNIDLAPRIPVKKHDIIKVYGQYEWNDKGGVVHWTHRDKRNKHPHGWVEHKNKRYQ